MVAILDQQLSEEFNNMTTTTTTTTTATTSSSSELATVIVSAEPPLPSALPSDTIISSSSKQGNGKFTFQCLVCFDEGYKGCLLCNCEHGDSICENCGRSYILDQMNKKLFPIQCPFPTCRKQVLEEYLMELLDSKQMSQFKALQEQERKKKYCKKCNEESHKGACKEMNRIFFESAKKNGYKCCPQCHRWIEKDGGCNNLPCVCGGTFCYVCAERVCQCHRRRRRKCIIM